MIKAQAEATSISVRATADAERICRLNDAMRTASESVVRRELLEAAGRIMAQTTTNTVVSENPVGAIMAMLGRGCCKAASTERAPAHALRFDVCAPSSTQRLHGLRDCTIDWSPGRAHPGPQQEPTQQESAAER